MRLLSTIFIYVSIPLYLIGYGTPYWMEKEVFPAVRTGLWHVCTEEVNTQNVTNDNITSWVCHDSKKYMVNSEYL